MTSIHTNAGAISALQTLRSIGSSMERTQGQVSSGLRIQSASDNAAYWSIATTMKSDNKALSAVEDALGFGAAVVDTMYSGMEQSIGFVSEFKAKLVAAREPGVDKNKINSELTQIKEQIRSIAYSSSFAGQQWLVQTEENWPHFVESQQVVGGFTRHANGSVSVLTIDVTPDAASIATEGTRSNYSLLDDTNGASTGDYGILTSWRYAMDLGLGTQWVLTHTLGAPNGTLGQEIELTDTTSSTDIDDMISVVDAMQEQMITASAWYGSAQTRIEMQQNFLSDLTDTIDKGIGRLVDVDMNEESTRLKAMQAQEQLGIQALQIANSNPENILALFR